VPGPDRRHETAGGAPRRRPRGGPRRARTEPDAIAEDATERRHQRADQGRGPHDEPDGRGEPRAPPTRASTSGMYGRLIWCRDTQCRRSGRCATERSDMVRGWRRTPARTARPSGRLPTSREPNATSAPSPRTAAENQKIPEQAQPSPSMRTRQDRSDGEPIGPDEPKSAMVTPSRRMASRPGCPRASRRCCRAAIR
jgi:hypothetical protein